MAYWLMKSEPETWSWEQQVKKGELGGCWDGVRNYQAAKNLRSMKTGDLAFFYHSGKKPHIVGIVEIITEFYIDPTDEQQKFVAVDVKAVQKLSKIVSLQDIKNTPSLQNMTLLRQSRLSVMPVTEDEWICIQDMAKK